MARMIRTRIPSDEGQRLLWAASIAQTAAILYVNDPHATEGVAVVKALELYANVIDHLDQGKIFDEDE